MKKITFLLLIIFFEAITILLNAQNEYMSEIWQQVELGTNLGSGGLYSVDLDNDGMEEILLESSLLGDSFFSILELKNGEFETRWTSRIYEFYFDPNLMSVKPYDLNNDSIYEIYALFYDGRIECFDAVTMDTIFIFQTQLEYAREFLIDDIDDDEQFELILTGRHYDEGRSIYVYDLNSMELEWSSNQFGSSRIEIGDVDNDGVKEIVMLSGEVIDGVSHSLDWNFTDGFGDDFKLGDVDNDQVLEIVTGDNDGIKTYDAQTQTLMWTIDPGYISFGGLYVGNIMGGNKIEIIYGSEFQGIKCYLADIQLQLWETDFQDRGITQIVSGDPDNDGVREILWGVGAGNSGPDHLLVNNAENGIQEWISRDTKGWFTFEVSDIEKDGQKKLAVSYFESGEYYNQGGIYMYDALTKALYNVLDTLSSGSEIRTFKISNINESEQDEIILGFADGYGYESIIILDGLTYEQLYRDRTFGNISSIEVADVDGDGTIEILFGNNASKIRIMNGVTYEIEWEIDEGCWYLCYVQQILVQDIDNDPALEIIFWFVDGDKVYVYDGESQQLEYVSDEFRDMSSLEVGDITGDGHPEFLIGDEDGDLTILDFVRDSVIDHIYLLNEELAGLKLMNIDNVEGEELICGGGRLRVFSTDDYELIWESRALLPDDHRAYIVQEIEAFNLDNDEFLDVFWSNRRGVFQFECKGYPVDDSIKFINPEAKWFVANTFPAPTPEYPDFVKTTSKVYGFIGDTIINNDTLDKFYMTYDSLFSLGFEYQSAIIEDGNYIGILDTLGATDTLYNFDLISGDSVRYEFEFGEAYLHVESVDSIEIGDKMHKRINFQDFESPPFYLNERWIEGLGSTHGPLFPKYPRLFSDEVPDSTLLTCYTVNDTIRWHHPGYEKCYTQVVLATPENKFTEIKVYPNPTHKWVNISYGLKEECTVSIIDQMGRKKIIERSENKIDFSNYPVGLYILDIMNKKGIHYRVKIIKR